MKTCLVTGGAGFIGSHLCEKLLEKNFRVICVDNLLTGSKKNIDHFFVNQNFHFIKNDVIKGVNIEEKIDFLFHFASPASPIDYQNYPVETLLVNSLGTKNCLDLAVKNKAVIMFASTSEIYGDPLIHPQPETYWGNVNPNGVRSCYDESKRFGESIVSVYQRKYNLVTKIIRIFNTYGPKMQKDDGRVISNFINQAINNKDITVNGKGDQTRSFCYVSDLVNGIIEVMFSGKSDNQVFNLGNPEEHRIEEIAKYIVELTESKSKIINTPMPADDPRRRKPDIAKIQKTIGWKPQVSLKDGLLRTIDYFKSVME